MKGVCNAGIQMNEMALEVWINTVKITMNSEGYKNKIIKTFPTFI